MQKVLKQGKYNCKLFRTIFAAWKFYFKVKK